MEKMLLKHLEGSKSGQTARFDLPLNNEIAFGRDVSAQVAFDPIKDDLVSRLHARLTQDPADKTIFMVTDLNSRNGTYVNGMRITGPAKLNPGDTIELGAGGPKIEFDLDPRPAAAPPATRISSPAATPGTRVAPSMTREDSFTPMQTAVPSSTGMSGISSHNAPPSDASRGNSVGRATVERMIHQTKKSNKKLVTGLTAGFVVLLALVGGGIFLYQQQKAETIKKQAENLVAEVEKKSQQEIQNVTEQLNQVAQTGEQNTISTTAGVSIAEKFTSSVVFIEASWKLIHTPTGKQLSQAYYTWDQMIKIFRLDKRMKKKDLGKLVPKNLQGVPLPIYILLNNTVEPYLVNDGSGKAIGGALTGSGFVVTDTGFILTNRHVAASWEVPYFQGTPPLPGFIIACGDANCSIEDAKVLFLGNGQDYPDIVSKIKEWEPSNTLMMGGKPARGKIMEGHLDYLDVTFPKTTTPWKASLQRISESADVALLKIQMPGATPSVPLCENDPCVKVGEMVTVMGYPGVSATAYAETQSYTMGSHGGSLQEIPEPTVTRGNVQKIIRGEVEAMGNSISRYYSNGEVFQLAINTTGHGNSGGPVFNDKGQVVGLFTYGWGDNSGASVSGAIPIKFGLDLMGSQQVIK